MKKVFTQSFHGRVLPFDSGSAGWYAKIVASRSKLGRPIQPLDAMIAAIACARNAAVATRNAADFADCGVRVINPWTA